MYDFKNNILIVFLSNVVPDQLVSWYNETSRLFYFCNFETLCPWLSQCYLQQWPWHHANNGWIFDQLWYSELFINYNLQAIHPPIEEKTFFDYVNGPKKLRVNINCEEFSISIFLYWFISTPKLPCPNSAKTDQFNSFKCFHICHWHLIVIQVAVSGLNGFDNRLTSQLYQYLYHHSF